MSLFKRMKRVISGKVNELDEKNIEAVMTDTLKELEEEYKSSKEKIKQLINIKKSLEEKYAQAQEEIAHWKDKARDSFKENDGDIAKQALEKKHSQDRLANKYERQLEKNKKDLKKQRAKIEEIEKKLSEAGLKDRIYQEEIN